MERYYFGVRTYDHLRHPQLLDLRSMSRMKFTLISGHAMHVPPFAILGDKVLGSVGGRGSINAIKCILNVVTSVPKNMILTKWYAPCSSELQ